MVSKFHSFWKKLNSLSFFSFLVEVFLVIFHHKCERPITPPYPTIPIFQVEAMIKESSNKNKASYFINQGKKELGKVESNRDVLY